ncbi:cell division protein FtsA [Crocinitomicaceae bacterium CZZ-1]|uniref:Cell division protein FtsA n=1 Tax=Taishania pollutisoli TaxID=2766479 RepID=A0A8J6PRZ3_9FLAO|nr:cell division protein FtsA [Taishania pollutisoli]MBC9813668.1 cell division protein FtsA [Taishania pollutisoli]
MSKVVVGLDIGTTKIACFVGTRNEHGKIEILAMGQAESLGVARGIVENIEKTIQSIRSAVEQTQESINGEYELLIRSAYVGVAGQHIKSMQHRGMLTRSNLENEISQLDLDALEDDMYKMLMPPGEQIIKVIPKQYIIDNQQGIKEPIGHAGVRLEANFHIITGNVGACTNIMRCVSRAGLEVKDLVLEPMASAEAVLSSEEKEAGVVLVDIGGGTTDIAVFHDGIIQHTAIIPFGGNSITEDIKEGCMIMRNQAERLKVKFGSALPSESQENEIVCIPGLRGREPKEISVRNLASIISARMTEIIELVDYEIINSGLKKKLIGGIVVTGGGAQLKHVKQLFEYVTGLDTRIGLPTEHLANTNELDKLASPMYSTGIGLVLNGFNDLDRKGKIGESATTTGTEKIARQTDKRRTGFFESLVEKGKSWFIEED